MKSKNQGAHVQRIILWVPNSTPAGASFGSYGKVRIEEVRRAVVSISWLPQHKSPTVKERSAVSISELIRPKFD